MMKKMKGRHQIFIDTKLVVVFEYYGLSLIIMSAR